MNSEITNDNISNKIKDIINNNKTILFMKGAKDQPMCGFSMVVVQILNSLNIDFIAINVLENEEIRQGIKKFSNWPTIPQLYVNKEFIGGCDIVREMFEDGELQELFNKNV